MNQSNDLFISAQDNQSNYLYTIAHDEPIKGHQCTQNQNNSGEFIYIFFHSISFELHS